MATCVFQWVSVCHISHIMLLSFVFQVCFSPADFEAVMSVVASLDEGKMELEQSGGFTF